jgi:predicted outer membrane repeat protein
LAAEKGGAIVFKRTAANANQPFLSDVTFHGNHAVDGGAISIDQYGHPILESVTISGNSADNRGGAIFGECSSSPSTLCFSASIVSGGRVIFVDDVAAQGPEIFVNAYVAVFLNNSLVYNTSAGQGACPATNCESMVYADPKLGALADNGGPTLTMLPGQGSAAIDAVSCVTYVDQRGFARPKGPQCDIGAVEAFERIFADGFDGEMVP